MNVLVTGGAGYIGSHAVQRLLADGHDVLVIDNLVRGHQEPMDILAANGAPLTFAECDAGNTARLTPLLKEHRIDTVLHFAALAYVGESVDQPLRYYHANTTGIIGLLRACDAANIQRFVLSSTCATYGEPDQSNIPIAETCPQNPINPYGASKLMCERVLFDYAAARKAQDNPLALAAFRYFNVAGSDRTGLIGEHHDPETHLIPICLQAALGQRNAVTIFGSDYPTPDGTCIRDYVHVEDLIDAHVTVAQELKPGDQRIYNLGIGKGYSVREVIDAAKRVTGVDFDTPEGARRPGDPPTLYANPAKIQAELGWSAKTTDLDEIIDTAWRWFKDHPRGYNS